MSDESSDADGVSEAAINRRRLLKGAAAAGVGAAAFAAPNITTLGFAPAYAQGSVIVGTLEQSSKLNANCNSKAPCSGGGAADAPEWGNGGTPGVIKHSIVSSNDTKIQVHQVGDVSTSGCAFSPSEATITQQPAGYFCVITQIAKGCASTTLTPEPPIASPAVTVPVAACPSGSTSPCNYFISASISCTAIP